MILNRRISAYVLSGWALCIVLFSAVPVALAAEHEWGVAELIETDDAGGAGYPQIVLDSAGNAVAVWEQSSSRDLLMRNGV